MHTDEEDFQHFLSYSGFRLSESPETIAKLKKAFMAGCPAPKPETDGDARKLAERILQIADDLQDKWDGGDHADMFDKVTERYIDKIAALIQSHDAALLASHGQEERALYLLGELMSYDNFQSYPSNLRERVGTFMARIENGTVPD